MHCKMYTRASVKPICAFAVLSQSVQNIFTCRNSQANQRRAQL